jgi:hypothetical protein
VNNNEAVTESTNMLALFPNLEKDTTNLACTSVDQPSLNQWALVYNDLHPLFVDAEIYFRRWEIT